MDGVARYLPLMATLIWIYLTIREYWGYGTYWILTLFLLFISIAIIKSRDAHSVPHRVPNVIS